MSANRRTNTKPETVLRSVLHRRGLRFRKDRPILTEARRVRPDIVFVSARVAVFVDGCYWHSCPDHATRPQQNAEFWAHKLDRTVERDRADNEALTTDGWTVIRVWEHVRPEHAATVIESKVLGPETEAGRSQLVQID